MGYENAVPMQTQFGMAAEPAGALAVIVVTYNSARVLPGLLDSLDAGLAGTRAEIVVIDNASADGSAEIAAAHPSRPRVIETGRNGGYAAGINAGLATIAAGTNVLVLNPDIRLTPGVVQLMRDRLGDYRVGVVVPRILEEDGRLSHSLRREPTVLTAWCEALLGGPLASRLNLGEVVRDRRLYQRGGAVDWATGAVLLVSAQARARVGAWDESFFLYSEEVDFMRRVRRAGFSIEYAPEAVVTHIGGDTRASPFLFSLSARNRVVDFVRWNRPLKSRLFRLAVAAGEGLRAWRGPEHRSALRAVLQVDLRPRAGG